MYALSRLSNRRLNYPAHARTERLPRAAGTRAGCCAQTHPRYRVRGSTYRRAVSKPHGRSRDQYHRPSQTVDAGQPDSCNHAGTGVDTNVATYCRSGADRSTKIHRCDTF